MLFVFLSTQKEQNNSHVQVSHNVDVVLGATSLSNDVSETELSDGSENLADGDVDEGDGEYSVDAVSICEEMEGDVAVQGSELRRSVRNSEELGVAPSSNDSMSSFYHPPREKKGN